MPHKSKNNILIIARNYDYYNHFYLFNGKKGNIIISSIVNSKIKQVKKVKKYLFIENFDNISLGLIDNLIINFAKCYNPKPKDRIVGYIIKGLGIS